MSGLATEVIHALLRFVRTQLILEDGYRNLTEEVHRGDIHNEGVIYLSWSLWKVAISYFKDTSLNDRLVYAVGK